MAERSAWRRQGDPPAPGLGSLKGPRRGRPPRDPTYGEEPDLLDKPGLIVEPDVRRVIAAYMRDMGLRR